MQLIIEIAGILVILLLILRFSLRRRMRRFGLRGGLTVLNVATGALSGAVVAVLLGAAAPPGAVTGATASDYAPLIGALYTLLPPFGAALGGMCGLVLLGFIWQRLFRGGTAAARNWLRRLQFITCVGALVFLIHRFVA
jgi:hypothetical protein